MKTANRLFAATAITVLAATAAAADEADMSTAIHDVAVTNNIPDLSVTVRNMSASTDPADRDLRVVSAAPQVHAGGQVWCKTLSNGPARAVSARLFAGNVSLHATQNGVDVMTLGAWAQSAPQNFSGTHDLENFSLDMALPVAPSWDGNAVILGLNPAYIVEQHLENYLAQNAGSEADFLRTDDVFETTIGINAAGWCAYEGQNYSGTYAGYRRFDVTVRIFYQGDPDIQDAIGTVAGPSTLTTPTPSRARTVTAPQGSQSSPPARTAPPPRRAPQR